MSTKRFAPELLEFLYQLLKTVDGEPLNSLEFQMIPSDVLSLKKLTIPTSSKSEYKLGLNELFTDAKDNILTR
jgi:hypothetical protein